MPPTVPLVDLGGWADGGAVERGRVAAEVDDACRRIGFLQVTGHGVPSAVVADMLSATTALFDLPLTEKLELRPPHAGINRGYAALGSEALAYSLGVESRPDLFEAFNVGEVDVPEGDPFYDDPWQFFAPNIWPDIAGFRDAVEAYFREARRVALTMTDVFALALGLPDGWFRPFVERSTTTLRVNHYERRAGDPVPAPGQMRMGAHTDYGVVTVLYADAVPGLEVLGSDGTWHGVIPEPGALVLNLGDLLAQWTNDRWRSTLHRVVPPDGDGPARRRSAAFFFDADHDAIVTCVPTCTDEANPPRYEPVTAGEHLMAKILGPRTFVPTSAVNTAADRL